MQKSYGTKAMALAIGIGLIFLLLGYKSVCRGVVLGALFSTINFVLMAFSFHAKIRPDRKKASLAALYNILFRYIFMAIPLFIAIKFPRFDLVATIAGLFMVQTVILTQHIYRNFQFSWRK
ncbi:ATP synthase subunit alpha (ATP synthase F0 sector subunit alpha) [Desulfosarcina variabilis str. Montpellier]